jgi:AP-1 complex subunit mu
MLALSRHNMNAAQVVIFLHRFVQVLVEYFKELEEESIRDNFVVIYELMDEMMDFGYPQTTESKFLQECVLRFLSLLLRQSSAERRLTAARRYITQESHKLKAQVRRPMAVTNAVSWRSEGIRYAPREPRRVPRQGQGPVQAAQHREQRRDLRPRPRRRGQPRGLGTLATLARFVL